jgi:hypothetical protein
MIWASTNEISYTAGKLFKKRPCKNDITWSELGEVSTAEGTEW